MSKKTLIIFLVIIGAISVLASLVFLGVITFPTMESLNNSGKEESIVTSMDELKDDSFYVWNNRKIINSSDSQEESEENIFQICPKGVINWKENTYANHTVWFSASNDIKIPTVYPGDHLLYVSATKVPFEGIQWERFADYGYTIGVANMEGDNSGHYYITLDVEDGYEGYVNPESDAYELGQFNNVSELFLDKLGSVRIRKEHISDGGTVLGLKKGTKYLCEWYSGTYYQDFELVADYHTFCSLETFTTYEYEFLHSRCISITIPDWLKSGYYYINGIGMFRYVSTKDQAVYNGEAYDENINWNDPIILYDERGSVIYDPSSMEKIENRETNSEEPKTNSSLGTSDSGNNNIGASEITAATETSDPFTQNVIDAPDPGIGEDEVLNETIIE